MKIYDSGANYELAQQPSADDVIDLAKRIIAGRYHPGIALHSPAAASDYFKLHIGSLDREIFHAVYLSTAHRVLAIEALFFGTIDSAEVHPREVVKAAIQHRAQSVIFAHNHPSGSCKSSAADRAITARLKEALALIDVTILDHLVVTASDTYSMSEHGEI